MTSTGFLYNGIGMSAYSQTGYDGLGYKDLLSRAVDMGVTALTLGSVSIIDVTTGVVKDWISTTGFNETASLASVGSAVADAQAKGLTVFLKPQINALNLSAVQYTGQQYSNLTDPQLLAANTQANTDSFFLGYKAYILQWAVLAQQYNVPVFSIGNEMLAATRSEYTAYWNDIIDNIRKVYSGKLTYAALVDVDWPANNEVDKIGFWNKLDYVGVDVYPNFPTGTATPTVAQFDGGWTAQRWSEYLSKVATSTGKQILFTETGIASYVGAANRGTYTDALIGQPGTQTDMVTQANWYQSFMDTWAGTKRPDWLAGAFFWNNDPPQYPGFHDATGYTIFDKPAAIVVTSAFGANNYFAANQNSFAGSASDDRIELYGNAGPAKASVPVHDATVTRNQTYSTSVTITLNGSIINGVTPTVHFYINGIDMGSRVLSSVPSTYVDPKGIISSDFAPFTFQVDSLIVSELKIAIDSPVIFDTIGNSSQVYIDSVDANGISLVGTNVTYFPLTGYGFSYALPNGAMPNGGYVLIDTTPYTNTLAGGPGTESNPVRVTGAGGSDTVYVLGSLHQYTISSDSSGITTLLERSGLHQNAVLTNIRTINFADGSTVLPIATLFGSIPLLTNILNESLLSVNLPQGFGLSLEVMTGEALTDLKSTLGAAVDAAGGGDVSVNSGIDDYILKILPADQPAVTVRTLKFAASPTVSAEPLVINGHAVAHEALAIDTSSLPAGSQLVLNNIDFAFLVGDKAPIHFGTGESTVWASSGNQEIQLGTGGGILHGGSGDDTLTGGAGTNQLYGDSGNDILYGGVSNDTLVGGEGNDQLDGGNGDDTVVFSGKMGDYSISFFGGATNRFTVADNTTAHTGTDSITNVEHFQFLDQTITNTELQAIVTPPPPNNSVVVLAGVAAGGAAIGFLTGWWFFL